jgi:crotonobetainyl-CoA:carnitine CoA-transferase CaiB-like acyl-CoA transferase
VVRPFMGPHLLPSVAYREGNAEMPYPVERLAPTLGQHNAEVLGEVLGLSGAEIDELRATEIIGDMAVAKRTKSAGG